MIPLASPLPRSGDAFLFEPAWAGDAWRGVVRAFLRSFAADEPVALVLALDPAMPGQLALDDAAARIAEVVAEDRRTDIPELLLVDEPAELLDTLRRFQRVHRIPLAPATPADAPGPRWARLAAALQGREAGREATAPRLAPTPDPSPPPAPLPAPSPAPRSPSLADLAPAIAHMARTGEGTDACLALGALPLPVHYYSPVPDLPDLERRKVWGRRSPLAGIDFREGAQVEYLLELGRAHGHECAWPFAATPDPHQFHLDNTCFSFGCAAALHAVLRRHRPRRVIEVGSGHSSRVISAALQANARESAPPARYTVIDPYPGQPIASLPSLTRLVAERVELTDPALFDELGHDDVLFIDSSHMVKIGGDVNFLFLEVLPRLAPGVIVHVHDIGLPYEYAKVYYTNPAFRVFWTEAYLLQAFLACNDRFEILLAMGYLMEEHKPSFRAAFPHYDPVRSPNGSGSFWFRRKPEVERRTSPHPDTATLPAAEIARLTPARAPPASSAALLNACTITPRHDGTYDLFLRWALGGRDQDATWNIPYGTPLDRLTWADRETGEELVLTRERLSAFLSCGYDIARQSSRAAGEPPRVAFTVKHSTAMGGGTINLYRLANWLTDLGVEVAIYSDEAPPTWTTLNTRFHHIPDECERYAAVTEPVVVVYSVLELPPLLRHARTSGKRIYHLCQGAEEFHFGPPATADLLHPIPVFDLLNTIPVGRIVVSPSLERYFAAKYGQRVHTVVNGIDTDMFEPTPRRATAAPGAFTVLTSGNPDHALKGVTVLRRAMALTAARHPEWRLHLVSVCGERLQRAKDPDVDGITSELRFGLTPAQMRDTYRAADVYVNASWYEGFGLPSLEAMACGVPLVQARNHGLDGIIEPDRDCLCVPSGDVEALAGALERILGDPALRDRLSQAGRATAQSFPLSRQRDMLAAAFSEITGAPLAPRAIATGGARPSFSILVPSYNQAHFLTAALDSLRAQTLGDWEAIVVNDGSTDGTAHVMERYAREDPRIRPFHKENGGVASALNRGLAEARGEWICWLSSDDLFLPHKLASHGEAIRDDPGLRFMHTNYEVLLEQTGRRSPSGIDVGQYIPPADMQVLKLMEINYLNGISIAVHRDVFAAIGGFDEALHYGQDYDLWLRASARFRSLFLDDATCVTRVHPGQGTTLFTEAGIYDSARAGLAFLNTRPYQDLFPFLDLTQLHQALRAVSATLRVAVNPAAFVTRCGYAPALLDRLREWLSGAPEPVRLEVCQQVASKLVLPDLSADVRAVLGAIEAVRPGSERYAPHDALTALERQASAVGRRGDARELAALERYLKMVRGLPPPARVPAERRSA